MIKVEKESLTRVLSVLKNFKSSVSVSKTWQENKNDNFSINHLRDFYKNESGKGLIERNIKIFPYKLNHNIHGSLEFTYSTRGILSFLYNTFKYCINYIYFPLLVLLHFNKLPRQERQIKGMYFYFFGKPFNGNIKKYIFQYKFLFPYLDKDMKNFLEVGGGYGGMSELIFHNFDVENYFIIDIPETLCLTSYYLSHVTDLNVLLIENERDIDEISNKKKNVILIPANIYENLDLENFKIDFFINSNSFAEIGEDFVKRYLKFFVKYSKKSSFFLSFNQTERSELHQNKQSIYSLDWASTELNGQIFKRFKKDESEAGIIKF